MAKVTLILAIVLWIYPLIATPQELIDKVEKQFNNVSSINVKGAFCSVEFEEGESSTVRFDGEIRATQRYDDFRIQYEQNGDQLNVWINNIPQRIIGQIKGLLHFEVPKNSLIKVDNTSGTVSVIGVGHNNVALESVSGNISVSDIPCNISLNSTSGTIKATQINGNLIANSTSGSINVSNVSGTASVESTSGTTNVQNVTKSLKISTTSGNIKIASIYSDVTGKSNSGLLDLTGIKGNLVLNNISGEIRLSDVIGSINATTTSGSIRGNSVMITGDSNFRTTSGSINFVLLNADKALSYDLESISGNLEANGVKGSKKLVISEGAIKIKGNTTSGNQKF